MTTADRPNGQAELQDVTATPLTVLAQYLKDVTFENPNPVQSFQETDEAPAIHVGIDVRMNQLGEQSYEVSLHILAEATRDADKLFIAEIEYAGIFTLSQVPAEAIHPLLMIECPRILFPYARQVIANLTREGGFPALSLNPIDFVDMYRRQVEQQSTDAPAKLNA